MKGKDAIRTALKEFIADPNLSLTFTSASGEVAKSGDIAYTQGFFTHRAVGHEDQEACH
jgi:ketosteroid isomerase-like protein